MIYTLGESLLDVIFTNLDSVAAKPGGSMLNTAVSLGRMKLPTSHISEVGSNEVALMLLKFLKDNGVETTFIKTYDKSNTSIAFAFLDKNKKPSYQFVSAYPPQRKLNQPPEFTPDDLLLFGSLYALSAPVRPDILQHLHQAKKNGSMVIYDPNIRHQHHLQEEGQNKALIENLQLADIIKASDEDCANIFGTQPVDVYMDKIQDINPEALIFITLGKNGAWARVKTQQIKMQALPTPLISTIGAGDAFNAGIIASINQQKIAKNDLIMITKQQISIMLDNGIKAATLVCGLMDNYLPKLTPVKL